MRRSDIQRVLTRRLIDVLAAPSESIRNHRDRRLVMLMAIFNLFTMPAGLVLFFIRPDFPPTMALGVSVLSTSFYLLSRSKYAMTSLKVQMLSALGVPIIFNIVVPMRQGLHISFLFPVLMATLMHSLRTAIYVAFFALASFLVVTHNVSHPDPSLRSASLLLLVLLMTVVILTKYQAKAEAAALDRHKERDRQKYLALVDSTFDGIATVSNERLSYVSEGFAKVFSSNPSAILGQKIDDFFQSTLKSTDPLNSELKLFSAQNAAGEMRFVQMISQVVNETETVIAVRDVTGEQDDNLRRLLLERITSTGMMASSVAHEMNTPLMIAQSQIEWAIKEQVSPEQTITKRLMSAQTALDQMESILKDLRWFINSGKNEYTTQPHIVVHNAIRLAHHRIERRTKIDLQITPLPPLAIAENKLSQLIINLVYNAAKARSDSQVQIEILITACRIDDDVEIRVRDNGVGIPPDLQQRIFEPFFTTDPDEGMGLGLALCQNIVQQAKGRISVMSVLNHGTTVSFRIPIHSGEWTEDNGNEDDSFKASFESV